MTDSILRLLPPSAALQGLVRAVTAADVVPVLVVRRELLEGPRLHKLPKLGLVDLALLLQVSSVHDDKLMSVDVLDGHALGHLKWQRADLVSII